MVAPQINAGRREAKGRDAAVSNILRGVKNAGVLGKTLADTGVSKNHPRRDTGEWHQPFNVRQPQPRGTRYQLDLVIDESAARTFQISAGTGHPIGG